MNKSSKNILPQLADAKVFPLGKNCLPLPGSSWKGDPANYPVVGSRQNYAVHTGHSGLIVLDLDVNHGNDADGIAGFNAIKGDNELPETLTVRTPTGGVHYYFKSDDTWTIGRRPNLWKNAGFPGIDVLGGPGYVAGPGSHRRSHEGKPDGRYEVVKDLPIAEFPEWLRAKCLAQIGEDFRGSKMHENRGTGSTAYEKVIDALAASGSHSDGLNWQCPAHDDRNPSMTVTDAGDRVLVKCHAGCDYEEIMAALDMDPDDGFDDEKEPWGKRLTAEDLLAQQAKAEADDDRELDLVPLSSVTMKRVRWFWDTGTAYSGSGGRIPMGTLSIGVGRPGAGKGQFACWLAANVTNGTMPGELNGMKKGVIFYSTEDSYAMTITPRLVAAGADLDKVYIFSTEAENTSGKFVVMKISQHLNRLRKLIEKYDIGLIILDPLLSAMSSNSDPNNDPAVRGEIEPLQMMLEETNCTGFGITHFRKMHDDDILNMISGSGAFARVVRSAIAFGAEKDDEGHVTRVISTVKNNLGRTDLPSYTYTFEESKVNVSDGVSYVSKLVMGEETDDSVEEIHERKVTGVKKTKTDLAAAWLSEKLNDGPMAKDDLMAAHAEESLPFSWGTVEKASQKIVFSDKPYGGKATWQLKF